MSKLSLKATLELIDRITQPLKKVSQHSKQLTNDFRDSARAVKNLERQMGDVRAFKNLQSELGKTNSKLKTAVQEEARLAAAIRATHAPTKAMQRDMAAATAAVAKLRQAQGEQIAQLSNLKNRLRSAGFETKGFAASETRLAERIKQATAAMERQRAAMRQAEAQQQRLNQVRTQYSDSMQTAGNLRSNGMMMMGAGAATLYSLKSPIQEAKRWEVEAQRVSALGMGYETTQQAIKFAKNMKTYGTSTLENLMLLRDGMTVFADLHHGEMAAPMLAKMKFSNETMYGQEHGAENEKKFMDMLKVIELRGGLKSEQEFKNQANIIQQVITATGGRVQPEEWLNMIKTGGIAAKLVDSKAFYYKMEPLVQEMGGFRVGTAMMSAYQNLYQGRTTKRAANNLDHLGLIADKSKVKHDKVGQVAYLDIGAIKGSPLFKKDPFAWMEQILVPALKAKGITKDDAIIDAIGSIFTNRTASNLFATMYQQREIIHKSAKLNEGADNIDQLEAKARATASGRELEAKAKLHDAYLKFSTAILPIYIKALNTAASALQNLTHWMNQHPKVTKAIGLTIIAIGGLLVVFGALALVLGILLVPLIQLRFAFALLRLTFGSALMGSWLFRGALILLNGTFAIVKGTILLFRGVLFLLRLAFLQTLTSIGAMTGALGLLAQAAAVFAAAYVGWQAGSAMYKYQQEKWDDPLGKWVVDTMAMLGSKNAKNMQKMGYGFGDPEKTNLTTPIAKSLNTPVMLRGVTKPVTPLKTKTVSPLRTGASPGRGQQINNFAAPIININGVTDPQQVGKVVDQKLQQFQLNAAATTRRSYSDQE